VKGAGGDGGSAGSQMPCLRYLEVCYGRKTIAGTVRSLTGAVRSLTIAGTVRSLPGTVRSLTTARTVSSERTRASQGGGVSANSEKDLPTPLSSRTPTTFPEQHGKRPASCSAPQPPS